MLELLVDAIRQLVRFVALLMEKTLKMQTNTTHYLFTMSQDKNAQKKPQLALKWLSQVLLLDLEDRCKLQEPQLGSKHLEVLLLELSKEFKFDQLLEEFQLSIIKLHSQ